jgi:flagellar basal-body rod protein FlgF
MDRMIYIAMAGAKAAMQRQDVVAANLANVSTTGFREELTAFRALPVTGDGASTRVYTIESTPGYNAQSGPIQGTGRALDVAMTGNAWLAVQSRNGTEAYTRAGALDVDSEGQLIGVGGLPVLGDGGTISVPANAELNIAVDGTITARVGNARPQTIGRLKLVTPEAPLLRGDDGLFRAGGGELAADPAARLQSGALEGSNVSPIAAMVAMIAAARQFEQQMKMMQTSQDTEQSANKLLASG